VLLQDSEATKLTVAALVQIIRVTTTTLQVIQVIIRFGATVAQLARVLVAGVLLILTQVNTVQVFLAKVFQVEMLLTLPRTVKVGVVAQVAQAVLPLEEPLITEVAPAV
jgi:hypothetical protein